MAELPMEGDRSSDQEQPMSALSRRTSDLEVEPSMPRVPLARRFNSCYSLALGLLVAVALLTAIATLQSNHRIQDLTSQAQQASEQPNRVLRIANLSEQISFQFDTADPGTVTQWQDELKQEANLLTRTQDGLLVGDPEMSLPAIEVDPQLQAIYSNAPDNLADTVRDYAGTANRIAALSQQELRAESTGQTQLAAIKAGYVELAADLQKAVRVYHDETAAEVSRQRTATLVLLATTLLTALGSVAFLFRPLGRSIHLETSQLEHAERMQRESNEFQTYRNNLAEALDTTTNKDEVLAAVGRAFMDVIPEYRSELLLNDASQAHLRREQASPERGPANCPVDSPDQCAALRRGQTMRYDSSRTLNVCPKLPEHEDTPCSAVCVPVTFNGRASGVIHVVAPEGTLPHERQIERLQVLAAETGSRLGILESTEQRDRQASTDGLTGLINRRELENRARELLLDHRPFAIAMADLDRFKELNDRHGHDSGDQALRLFAAVLQADLRPSDIASRYGGEEFVILLPDTDVAEAEKTIKRLQRSLADQIRKTGFLHFTASWGVTDSESATTFRDIVGVADGLMYTAKREGRNLMVIDREAAERAGVTPDDDAIVDGSGTLAPAPQIDLDLQRLEDELERSASDDA
jgi:diguanylate cyclase (GGDEF)-like protein